MNDVKQRSKIVKISGGLTIALFTVIFILESTDQAFIDPLLNPLLLDFFYSDAKTVPIGWIKGIFVFLMAVAMIIAGIFADRGSRKKLCLFGTILYSSVTTLTILIPHGIVGYWLYFFTRILNGIGIGIIIPTIYSIVGDTADPKKRTMAFAWLNVGSLMGLLIGYIAGGLIEAETGNWRLPYFYIGAINFVLAFLLIILEEPKRGSKEVELRDAMSQGAEYTFRLRKEDLKYIWQTRSNFWLIINFIDCFPDGIILFLLFKYMEDYHNVHADIMSIILLASILSGVFGSLIVGRLGDIWFQREKRAKVILALLCNGLPSTIFMFFLFLDFRIPEGSGFAEAFANPNLLMALIILSLVMLVNQGVGPNWYSTLTDINLPEHRATMISFANFMDMIGRSVGPLIGAYIADALSLQAAMWAAVIFWYLNIVLWFPIFKYIKKDLAKIHNILSERAMELKPK